MVLVLDELRRGMGGCEFGLDGWERKGGGEYVCEEGGKMRNPALEENARVEGQPAGRGG